MLTIFVRYGLGLSMNGWVGGRDECIKQLEKYPGSNDNETSLLVLGESTMMCWSEVRIAVDAVRRVKPSSPPSSQCDWARLEASTRATPG